MKNAPKLCYFLLMSLLVIFSIPNTSAYATNGIKVIGVGPVQRSMGGASVGLPLDAGTTITNPAGISEIGGRVDLGMSVAVPYSEYRASSAIGQVTNNDRTIKSRSKPFLLPAFGLVLPITDNFTTGFGIYGISGIGVDYEENLYNNVTMTRYQCAKISPALAYNFNDVFSIGLAPSMDYATFDYEAAAIGQQKHKNGIAIGWGYTIGTLIKPFNAFKCDLPFGLEKDFLSIGAAYESQQYFADFKYNTDDDRDKLSLNLPQSASIGIGVKPIKKLRVALDVSWIDWPQVLGEHMPVYNENNTNAALWNANWKDQWVYKIGMEFDLIEKMFVDKLTLRAGYNYGKHPLRQERAFENIGLGAVTEHHITAGVGIEFAENLGVNIGFVFAPQISYDTANPTDLADPGSQFIENANVKAHMFSIDAGLVYKF